LKYTKHFILLVIVQINSLVFAQKKYSLQECAEIAINNNINLQQQKLQEKSVKADFNQSRLNSLPTVNGSATNNWQTGFAINPRTNLPEEGVTFRTNSFGVSANMVLFNGLQNTNNIKLAKNELDANKFDVEAVKNNIVLNVCNAYLRVLLNEELVKAAKNSVQTTKKQAERQEKLYSLGSSNKTRLLQLKAQLAAEELALTNANNQTLQSYTELWLLLNLKPDTSNKIEFPDFLNLPITDEPRSAEEIYNEFAKVSPEVNATQKRIKSLQIQKQLSVGGRSPRISLNASISSFFTTQSTEPTGTPTLSGQREIGYWNNNGVPVPVYVPTFSSGDIRVKPFNNQLNQNLGSLLGINMQVPVFNGWAVNTNIKKAEINLQNAKLNDSQTRNTLYQTITIAYTNFKAALKRTESTKQNYDANKEAFDQAEKQFEFGAINIIDYLNIKNSFMRAETDYTSAKFELLFRRKVLDFYLKKPLF